MGLTESAAVPPGYKQTEVGVIPEDWEVQKIGDLFNLAAGGDLDKPNFSPEATDKYPYPIYANALTRKGLYGYSSIYGYECEGLTVTARGDVGKAQYRNGRFSAIGRLLVLMSTGKCDARFATEYINGFVEFALESTGVPQLTVPQISKYSIALPPRILEQQAIAEALSDADALIEGLEALIAKKLQIKQGAMQELLTGERRLQEFSHLSKGFKKTELGMLPEDWIITDVNTIAEVKTGPFGSALHEKDYVSDGTPIITVEHLGERGVTHVNLPKVSNKDKKRLNAYTLRENDIVFSRVGSVDRNAIIKKVEDGWLFSGRLLRVRLRSTEFNALYLTHHFHSKPFKQRVREVAVGQTMPSINTRILAGVKVIAPPTSCEQYAIASILSDMDAEIAVLEGKLAKARRVKAGMMQDLLTGRVRLL